MSGNDQLTQGQLTEVKRCLNVLVKEQLIDDNKFQVSEIHKLLTTFNMTELEKELASTTKQTFLNVADLLDRSTLSEDADLVGSVQADLNKARNAEHKETTEVFIDLMDDDRWDSPNDGGSSSAQAYGKATRKMDKYNALEAILTMCFGGLQGVAPASGHAAAEARGGDEHNWATPGAALLTAQELSSSDNKQLNIDGQEARATFMIALWAKHASGADSPIKIFGSAAMKIRVRHISNTGASADCTLVQQFCKNVDAHQDIEVREYHMWDQTSNGTTSAGLGKNHFANVLGALLKYEPVESRQIGKSKLLGGEESLTIDQINSLCSDADAFSTDQLKRIFVNASKIEAGSSVAQLNNVRALGFNNLKETLGIVVTKNVAGVRYDTNKTAAENFAVDTRLAINQNNITTPSLQNILESDFGDELLKELALYDSSTSLDLRSIETLVGIAHLDYENNVITRDVTLGKETGEIRWQALQSGLNLINRAERLGNNLEVSVTWLDLLAKHDNSTTQQYPQKQITIGFMNGLISDKTYSGLQSDSSYILREGETVFDYITYNSRADEFALDESMQVKKTLADLYPNEYYATKKKSSIKGSAQKIILSNFQASPGNFLDNLAPQVAIWKKQANKGTNGQVQANLDSAFGNDTFDDTSFGAIFNEECKGLGNKVEDFAEEKARIFVFLFSMIHEDRVKELLKDELVYNQVTQQSIALLKVTPKSAPNAAVQNNTLLKYRNTTEIRVAVAKNVLGKIPYLAGNVASSDWISLSGKIIDKKHFGSSLPYTSDKETVRDYAINALAYGLFNGNTNETCKLQLVNGIQLSAIKVQELAKVYGTSDDVADFEGNDILEITKWTALKTMMADNGDQAGKIYNQTFVSAAFSAIAKATRRPNLLGTYYAPSAVAGGIVTYVASDTQTTRNISLIDNIRDALDNASDQQVYEFFYMMADMAQETTPSGETDKIFHALAESIMNHLALQLAENETRVSTHHLPKAWLNFTHDKITGADSRKALTEAAKRYFDITPISTTYESGLIKLDGDADSSNKKITQDDINTVDAFAASTRNTINKVDMYVNKLAKFLSKRYTLSQVVNEVLFDAATDSQRSNLGKLLVCYTAAYKYEKPSEAFRLYDVPNVSCAGFRQYTITRIVETGFMDAGDLETVMHTVKVVDSVDGSFTHAASEVEPHRFVAIDTNNRIVSCEAFTEEGVAVYGDELDSTAKLQDYKPDAAAISDEIGKFD